MGSDYVRGKIASYLNDLISIGVAGFRVDAVKHMWPGDLQIIYDLLMDLSTDAGFPPNTRAFIYNEVSAVMLVDLAYSPSRPSLTIVCMSGTYECV